VTTQLLFTSLSNLRANCLTSINDTFLEEFFFRILINPDKCKLLKTHHDILSNNKLTITDTNTISVSNSPTWASNAKNRADRWLSITSDNMLCRVLLVNETKKHGTCISFSIKDRPQTFSDNYGRDFLTSYKNAWDMSVQSIEMTSSIKSSLYNDFEIIGFPTNSNTDFLRFEGSSAFLSFYIPLVLMSKNLSLSPFVAFAGAYSEVTGMVEPVSGIDLKLQAACNYGIKVLFIHEQNYNKLCNSNNSATEVIPYSSGTPNSVACEILEHLSSIEPRYPGKMYSKHIFLAMQKELISIDRTLMDCSRDIYSRDPGRVESTFHKILECKEKLEVCNQANGERYINILILLLTYYNNIANFNNAQTVVESLLEYNSSTINPEQVLRFKNLHAISYQDTFQINKSNTILIKAIENCTEFKKKTEDNSILCKIKERESQLKRTLAQNLAYSGKSKQALHEFKVIGKLESESDDVRFFNYLLHAICDLNNKQEWESIKKDRSLFKESRITEYHGSVFDIHSHVKGFLVFESISDCCVMLDSLPLDSSLLFRRLKTHAKDPYAGLVLRCIGLMHEKIYHSSNDSNSYSMALSFYNLASKTFSANKSVFCSIQHALSLAYSATISKDTGIASASIDLLKETLAATTCTNESSVWLSLKEIVLTHENDVLNSCNQFKLLLKRFQWW